MGLVKGCCQFVWELSELIELCYTVSKHFIFEYIQALVFHQVISGRWLILKPMHLDRRYPDYCWVGTIVLNSLLRILSASISWCKTLAQLIGAYWTSYKCRVLLIYWWLNSIQAHILALKWFVGCNIRLLRGTLWLAHKWCVSQKLIDVTAYDFNICSFWTTCVIIITSRQRYPLKLASRDTSMLGVSTTTYYAIRHH